MLPPPPDHDHRAPPRNRTDKPLLPLSDCNGSTLQPLLPLPHQLRLPPSPLPPHHSDRTPPPITVQREEEKEEDGVWGFWERRGVCVGGSVRNDEACEEALLFFQTRAAD